MLDDVAGFIVLNLRSRCVVGWVINCQGQNLTGEQLYLLLELLLEEIINEKGEMPAVF